MMQNVIGSFINHLMMQSSLCITAIWLSEISFFFSKLRSSFVDGESVQDKHLFLSFWKNAHRR